MFIKSKDFAKVNDKNTSRCRKPSPQRTNHERIMMKKLVFELLHRITASPKKYHFPIHAHMYYHSLIAFITFETSYFSIILCLIFKLLLLLKVLLTADSTTKLWCLVDF